MPENVMLCLTAKDIPVGENWIYQVKYDGCRCIAELRNRNATKPKLINRRGADISERYCDLKFDVFSKPCIVDGEICVLDRMGKPSFNLLQHREHIKNRHLIKTYIALYPVAYYVFDILEIDGRDVTKLPFIERQKLLWENYNPKSSCNVMIAPLYDDGRKLFEAQREAQGEGIIAKQKSSIYEFRRSSEWLKIKCANIIDVDVVGYTTEKREISAIITPLGKVNFALPKHLYDIWAQKLISKAVDGEIRAGHFKAEIEYLEMTADNKMRFPKLKKLYETEV